MPASLKDNFRRFVTLTADLGMADGARLALREMGVHTHQTVTFPGLQRKFEVQFDPVWRWIERGNRERGLLRFAEERIGAGSTVLDVGAHIGESTLLFSELVGPSGRVVAFEPDPAACSSLRKNLEMNGIANVLVEEEVVSNMVGEVQLRTDRFGSGLSSIVSSPAVSHRRAVEVASTTLDAYCEAHGLSPDWVKIDAEGAEPLIVQGMQHVIQRARPSVILEFHSAGLTEDERRIVWSEITSAASGVAVLESSSSGYGYLEQVAKGMVPPPGFLIVYLRF